MAARARRAVTPPLGELEQSIAEPVRAATSLQAASLHDQLRAAYLGTGARASAGAGAAAQRAGGLGGLGAPAPDASRLAASIAAALGGGSPPAPPALAAESAAARLVRELPAQSWSMRGIGKEAAARTPPQPPGAREEAPGSARARR